MKKNDKCLINKHSKKEIQSQIIILSQRPTHESYRNELYYLVDHN